jgi:hypothetical protein
MPWQLIYTSAPRGLLSGQSGFCTVARSADLRETLVQRLEQISSYHYLRVSAVGTDGGNPTISAFRILDIRGAKYQVLTRIQPCGLDFTARTNHLARHVVFQPGELAQLPSPAVILRDWHGWSATWQGEPRLLDDVPADDFRGIKKPTFPAQAWLQMTGDAGRAAGLLDSDCLRGCYLICPPGGERRLLDMFAETLQLLDHTGQYPLRPWRHSFTTFMQAEDNPLDFQWRGCQDGTPAYQQAVQRSAPMLALRAIKVPNNSLTKIARDSQRTVVAPAAAAPRAAAAVVRREPSAPGKKAPPAFDTVRIQSAPGAGEKSRFLSMNLWIDSSTLARLGIFVAVILVLLGAKIWLNQHRAGAEPRPSIVVEGAPQPPVEALPQLVAAQAASTAPLDLTQLDGLWAEGPTYLVLTSNMSSFHMSIQNNSPFQNLIHRYDSLNLLPAQVQLLLSIGQWDVASDKPLPVNGRKGRQLTAGTDGNAQCVFDYSEWLASGNEPLYVQTSFGTPPAAISARFTFSSTNDGDPFRLLVINPNDPPAPLIMARGFVQAGGHTVAGSLRPALEQRLSQIHLLGGQTWRLRPFVKTKDGRFYRYLYENWPPDQTPPAEGELDFADVKKRLTFQRGSLKINAVSLEQELAKWPRTGFDLALGEILQSTNKHLISFTAFAGTDYSTTHFIMYLGELKKDRAHAIGLPGWPSLGNDSEPADLAEKFQRLYTLLTDKIPASAGDLTLDNTNYFYATWLNLRKLDAVRREATRAAADLQELQDRLDLVPAGLEGTAYVGLFIVGRREVHPRVEMIRFQ